MGIRPRNAVMTKTPSLSLRLRIFACPHEAPWCAFGARPVRAWCATGANLVHVKSCQIRGVFLE